MHVIDVEQPEGVILQYGGQTAIKLAEQLDACGINILGTSYEGIHKAEDRHEFSELISALELKQPHGTVVYSLESLNEALGNLDFPLLCRPSYVIGGQGMKIVQDTNELMIYMKTQSIEEGILLDEYLEGIEVEVDCITDGENIIIPGIMEHLELSGVHSGDSTSVYPPQSFSIEALDRLEEISLKVCRGLKAIGLVNIQYIYAKDVFYIIEVNPRASRTIPFLSKVTGVNMIELATKVMLGEPLGVHHKVMPEFVAVKVPIFSMEKIRGVDVALGPEMKSTGELMSIDQSLELALKKSQHAQMYPTTLNSLFVSISDRKKTSLKGLMKLIKDANIALYATAGTAKYLTEYGLKVTTLDKLESSSIIIEKIKAHEFDMIINVPSVGSDTTRDGFKIRRQAIESRVQSFSSIEAATCYLKAEFEDKAYKIVDICTLS
jgi:carbamoyl-phosphate synthase large subunit